MKKQKIKLLVKNYYNTFPSELQDFKKGQREKKSSLKNKFGEVKGDLEMRLVMEMPETLHHILKNNLTEEENSWIRGKGLKWFLENFPVFKVSEKL
jgi:hypothetical protein